MIRATPLRLLFGALLLLAGIRTWQLAEQPATQGASPTLLEQRSGPRVDYYARNFQVVSTDAQGKPIRRLWAEQMRHYRDDNTTELDQPDFRVFAEDRPPIRINSENGWISADGEMVLLSGPTVLLREGSDTLAPLRIVTSNVRIQPNQDYAETDEKATVTSGASIVHTTGMQAWLRAPSRYKFLSEVRGHYVPD